MELTNSILNEIGRCEQSFELVRRLRWRVPVDLGSRATRAQVRSIREHYAPSLSPTDSSRQEQNIPYTGRSTEPNATSDCLKREASSCQAK